MTPQISSELLRTTQDHFRITQDCSLQLRSIQNPSEPLRTPQDPLDIFRAAQDHSGLFQDNSGLFNIAQGHLGFFKTPQDPSKPLRRS